MNCGCDTIPVNQKQVLNTYHTTLFKYNIAAKNLINKKKKHNNIVEVNNLSLFKKKKKNNKKILQLKNIYLFKKKKKKKKKNEMKQKECDK
jgi:hypothetical protein